MQDPHARGRIAGRWRRGLVASGILWCVDAAPRGAPCEGRLLAGLDATLAPIRDADCQEQAFGLACLSGRLAAGEETFVGAGDFFALWPCHGSVPPAEDEVSLPTGRTRPCSNRGPSTTRGFPHRDC